MPGLPLRHARLDPASPRFGGSAKWLLLTARVRRVLPLTRVSPVSVVLMRALFFLCFLCSNPENDVFLLQELENNYLCILKDFPNYLWIPRLVRRVASSLGFFNGILMFSNHKVNG